MALPATEAPLDPLDANNLKDEKAVMKRKKKKKLTPAEKLELKRKEEQEFKLLEMRDQIKREYELSKKTAMKYRERWETMCREIKLKEMRQELVDWEEKVNRVWIQKDEKIKLILDEIATTEEFHRQRFSNHLQLMDYLMDTWKTFQETSRLLYENDASELLHDFYREVEEKQAIEDNFKLNCESVAHATEILTENEILSDYKIFLEKRDERVTKEIEKRYQLRDAVIKQMKALRKQLLEFLHPLLNASLDTQKNEHINSLMERQRNFVVESLKLNSAEEHNYRAYAALQKELVLEEREAKRKLNDLQLEHAYFLQMRKNIESEMKLNREQTYEKLRIVTSESFGVIKKYEKLYKFGELLLSLAANCRKFQTEREKVLPWGDFEDHRSESEADSEPFELKVMDLKQHVDISEAELQNNARLMQNFWRRQAIAEAQVVLLKQQKLQLLKENQNYIATIKSLSKADNVEDLKDSLKIISATTEN